LTDATANNYSESANKDDGSCLYNISEPPIIEVNEVEYSLTAYGLDMGPDASGGTWYNDVILIINDDTMGNLNSHTTNQTQESILDSYYDNRTPLPTGGIVYPIELNTTYNFKVIGANSQLLLMESTGIFSAYGEEIEFSDDMNYNETNLDTELGTGTWDEETDIIYGVNDKIVFQFGMIDYP
jgi:hypothetical protein